MAPARHARRGVLSAWNDIRSAFERTPPGWGKPASAPDAKGWPVADQPQSGEPAGHDRASCGTGAGSRREALAAQRGWGYDDVAARMLAQTQGRFLMFRPRIKPYPQNRKRSRWQNRNHANIGEHY
jgi:hypothetical protein